MEIHRVPIANPESTEPIEVWPMADLHVGDPGFCESKLKFDLKRVSENPRAYIILLGDLINNATKGSVSNVYDELMSPTDQGYYVTSLLEPVREKIVGIVSGNHERRSRKEVDLDPDEIIADKLKVPYFGDEALVKFTFGNWARAGQPISYLFYGTHGSGGGRRVGGKANRLEDLFGIVPGCDVYLRAHTHQPLHVPQACYLPNSGKQVAHLHEYHLVSTGSYLNRAGYAVTHEYKPLPMGCPIITLSGRERHVEVRK